MQSGALKKYPPKNKVHFCVANIDLFFIIPLRSHQWEAFVQMNVSEIARKNPMHISSNVIELCLQHYLWVLCKVFIAFIIGRIDMLQGDQLYMAVCFWYPVKSDFSRTRAYSIVQWKITVYKVPGKHGHVYLVGLYMGVMHRGIHT